LNISTPVWGSDNVLVISSAYSGGSRALIAKRRQNDRERTLVQQSDAYSPQHGDPHR
jgi:hypothetical protein